MLAPVLLSLVGAMLLGALLLILGLRGKRLNDHPTCRDCGFDLQSIYPANITCPECGSGLKRPKAVRTGQRRRRPVFIALGVFLIAIPTLPIAAVAFAAITGSDVNQYKPLGLLLWEARHTSNKNAKSIATELESRMLSGKLTPAQEDSITTLALDRQEDPKLAWDEAWGELIERAKLDNRFSPDQDKRFLRDVIVPRMTVRPRIAAGDPIPIQITCDPRTGGSLQSIGTVWLKTATIDGKPIKRSTVREDGQFFPWNALPNADFGPLAQVWAVGSKGQTWMAGRDSDSMIVFDSPADLAPGRRTVRLELLATASTWTQNNYTFTNNRPSADDPKARPWTLEYTIDVAPKGQVSIEKVPASEDLAAKLAESLRPANAMYQNMGYAGSMLNMTISVDNLPVPVAFEVTARVGDKEYPIGTFTSGHGGGLELPYSYGEPNQRQLYSQAANISGSKMDLIFKPRPDLAIRTTDLTRVYNGAVEIKGVDFQRMDQNAVNISSGGSDIIGSIVRKLLPWP